MQVVPGALRDRLCSSPHGIWRHPQSSLRTRCCSSCHHSHKRDLGRLGSSEAASCRCSLHPYDHKSDPGCRRSTRSGDKQNPFDHHIGMLRIDLLWRRSAQPSEPCMGCHSHCRRSRRRGPRCVGRTPVARRTCQNGHRVRSPSRNRKTLRRLGTPCPRILRTCRRLGPRRCLGRRRLRGQRPRLGQRRLRGQRHCQDQRRLRGQCPLQGRCPLQGPHHDPGLHRNLHHHHHSPGPRYL